MTQAQLQSAVARATGEPIRTIRDRGFHLVPEAPAGLTPGAIAGLVACPHCRRFVPDPGTARDGAPLLAECLDCDAYFDARRPPAAGTRPRPAPGRGPFQ